MILFPKVVVKHSGTVCSAHTNEPIEVNISLPVARTRQSRDNINDVYVLIVQIVIYTYMHLGISHILRGHNWMLLAHRP